MQRPTDTLTAWEGFLCRYFAACLVSNNRGLQIQPYLQETCNPQRKPGEWQDIYLCAVTHHFPLVRIDAKHPTHTSIASFCEIPDAAQEEKKNQCNNQHTGQGRFQPDMQRGGSRHDTLSLWAM